METQMPLIRISLRDDTPTATQAAISDGAHRALVDAIGIPANDKFQLIDRYPPDAIIASPDYLGGNRINVVFVEVTLTRGRPAEAKTALIAGIARNLAAAGVRAEDVYVTLVENGREDWSAGLGRQHMLDEALMRSHGWAPAVPTDRKL
jgi:phenylpyruvate tautomerase PptA (4-oxalocrotonate tautomerase family)